MAIIAAAMDVHRALGPGLYERVDVIVEAKCVERLLPIHTAQILTYLRLTGARQAFLINFNGVTLKEGLRSYLGSSANRSPQR